MGLFDFIKKKKPEHSSVEPEKQAADKSEPYLGDLEKTKVIFHLVKTPGDQRDQKWQKTFLENIAQASFRCGDPQVITGPDGFPYFQLFLPEPNQNFQCFVIEKMKDDFLLKSGFGVVINPTPSSADYVFSFGDILNFHLNNTFYTSDETSFSKEKNDETIATNEEVMIGQPSALLFPKEARQLIADFLRMNGIKHPKVLLLMRHRQDGNGVSQDLVFNLTPENFDNENKYRSVMQTISWYLPRHYSFVGMDENVFSDGFMTL